MFHSNERAFTFAKLEVMMARLMRAYRVTSVLPNTLHFPSHVDFDKKSAEVEDMGRVHSYRTSEGDHERQPYLVPMLCHVRKCYTCPTIAGK